MTSHASKTDQGRSKLEITKPCKLIYLWQTDGLVYPNYRACTLLIDKIMIGLLGYAKHNIFYT